MRNHYCLYQGDCLKVLPTLEDESVDLVVTSPPYFNEKEYSFWGSFEEYLGFIHKVFYECYRVLNNGCRLVVNVADIYSKNGDILPLNAKTELLLFDVGFLKDSTIIWDKSLKGAKDTAWGSWRMPSNPCIQSFHEILLVFKKEGKRVIKDSNYRIDKSFFLEHVQSIWRFRQETQDRKHPAPFPENLPLKCINLWTYPNETVLDPFIGSGTTMKTAQDLGRNCVGIEISPEYCEVIRKRCFGRQFLDREPPEYKFETIE